MWSSLVVMWMSSRCYKSSGSMNWHLKIEYLNSENLGTFLLDVFHLPLNVGLLQIILRNMLTPVGCMPKITHITLNRVNFRTKTKTAQWSTSVLFTYSSFFFHIQQQGTCSSVWLYTVLLTVQENQSLNKHYSRQSDPQLQLKHTPWAKVHVYSS